MHVYLLMRYDGETETYHPLDLFTSFDDALATAEHHAYREFVDDDFGVVGRLPLVCPYHTSYEGEPEYQVWTDAEVSECGLSPEEWEDLTPAYIIRRWRVLGEPRTHHAYWHRPDDGPYTMTHFPVKEAE